MKIPFREWFRRKPEPPKVAAPQAAAKPAKPVEAVLEPPYELVDNPRLAKTVLFLRASLFSYMRNERLFLGQLESRIGMPAFVNEDDVVLRYKVMAVLADAAKRVSELVDEKGRMKPEAARALAAKLVDLRV